MPAAGRSITWPQESQGFHSPGVLVVDVPIIDSTESEAGGRSRRGQPRTGSAGTLNRRTDAAVTVPIDGRPAARHR